MSGHSHFKNIKRKKEASDLKKALSFSKISGLIASAVRKKGRDPQSNPSLRFAIARAKEIDMPKANIERAIKRGSGEGGKGKLQSFVFEAYGPENIAIIIEGLTDNKNRTLGDIKEVLKNNNGKLAPIGSVKWLFNQRGVIEIENMDENTSFFLIEKGADDIEKKEASFLIYTSLNNIENLVSFLSVQNIAILSSYSIWQPKMKINKNKEKCQKIIEDLQNLEDVENLYTNL